MNKTLKCMALCSSIIFLSACSSSSTGIKVNDTIYYKANLDMIIRDYGQSTNNLESIDKSKIEVYDKGYEDCSIYKYINDRYIIVENDGNYELYENKK